MDTVAVDVAMDASGQALFQQLMDCINRQSTGADVLRVYQQGDADYASPNVPEPMEQEQ